MPRAGPNTTGAPSEPDGVIPQQAFPPSQLLPAGLPVRHLDEHNGKTPMRAVATRTRIGLFCSTELCKLGFAQHLLRFLLRRVTGRWGSRLVPYTPASE